LKVKKAMQSIQMQEWLRQIHDCQQSGLSVTEWCSINGINTKTYYFRRRRVREELLEEAESIGSLILSNSQPSQSETPVFASIPAPNLSSSTVAATVQIGAYITEINNGADLETVDGVLRTLSRL
jgi:hypothetical protein